MKRTISLSKALIAILLSSCSLSISARSVYLSASGNDNNNGTSFANAFATFSKALASVKDGESIYVSGMINMADDPENTETDIFYKYTKYGFKLEKSITIRGESKESAGFIGMNDDFGTRFFRVGEGITLTLQDLTLTKGTGADKGGAVLVNGGKLIGKNLIFSENEVEAQNDATMGAAIHVDATAGISLKNCRFYKNKAQKGPGMYIADVKNQYVEINLESCFFIENEANGSPSAGAVFIRMTKDGNLNNTVNMINCTVAKNKASANGGAIHVYGVPESTTVAFINCTITDNENSGPTNGDRGGGIMIGENIGSTDLDYCKVYIQNCIIERNSNAITGETTTKHASDLTCGRAPSLESLQISHSYIGRATTWSGSIADGCYTSCRHGYMSQIFNPAQAKAGMDDFSAENFAYPLKEDADALAFGNALFLDEVGIFNDAIGRERAFANGKCSAGAMEGAGLPIVLPPVEEEPIPPFVPCDDCESGVSALWPENLQVYVKNNQLVVRNCETTQSLELFSITGLLIAKTQGNAGTLLIPVKRQGVYIARIVVDGQVYSQKVIF